MNTLQAFNVNDALVIGLSQLLKHGIPVQSRNGRALMMAAPVTTSYLASCERVLFSPERDVNPFFHLMEAMWMLDGRKDVHLPAYFSPGMKNFSVDGETLHGAYGYRWRKHFGFDQVEQAITDLIQDPMSRRVVIGMWDPCADGFPTEANAKDRPCNDLIKFQAVPTETGHQLNMSVFCRSNDAVWGAYGANVVHFSYLHQYVAEAAGMRVGTYHQISDNFHIYDQALYGEKLFNSLFEVDVVSEKTGFPVALTKNLNECFVLSKEEAESESPVIISRYNHYTTGEAAFLLYPFNVVSRKINTEKADYYRKLFDNEVQDLLNSNGAFLCEHPFLRLVVRPIWETFNRYKETKTADDLNSVIQFLQAAEAEFEAHANTTEGEYHLTKSVYETFDGSSKSRLDWFLACEEWLERRAATRREKEAKADTSVKGE